MVEIGGRPILWHIMKIYASYGIKDFVLCLGYKGEMIKEYFLNYEAINNDFTVRLGSRDEIVFHNTHTEADWSVTLASTGDTTLTAGRIRMIRDYIGDERFCVTYGDGVADIRIDELLAFHEAHGRLATVSTVQIPSRFGVLDLADDGQVRDFAEKATTSGWVNGGFFVFEPQVFDYLAEDAMLEHIALPNLTNDGQLMAWQHRGFWQPMDTFRETTLLNEMWAADAAPWKVW
jgi:glucose-1-phosphate cytidylyltransferase